MDLTYFTPTLRLILGGFFVITAGLKFSDLKGFSKLVSHYELLPKQLIKPLAYAHPFIAFTIGTLILLGEYIFYASLAGAAMTFIGAIFIVKALSNKNKMKNCGCYGTAFIIPLTWKKAIENIIWTALFLFLVYLSTLSTAVPIPYS